MQKAIAAPARTDGSGTRMQAACQAPPSAEGQEIRTLMPARSRDFPANQSEPSSPDFSLLPQVMDAYDVRPQVHLHTRHVGFRGVLGARS